jgi:phenylalanyl-tRNA synthetase beta chain
LKPFGFEVGEEFHGVVRTVVPSFRPDCSLEADIIEEIARHEGYGSLGERRLQSPFVGGLTPYQRDLRHLSDLLVSRGYFELMGSALVSDGDSEVLGLEGPSIRASNPLSADESVLRRTLLSTAVRALRFNAARRRSEVAFFEIGEVFSLPLEGSLLPDETTRLGVLATSGDNGAVPLVRLLSDLGALVGLRSIEIIQGNRGSEDRFKSLCDKLPSPGSWPQLHFGRSGIVVVDGSPCGIVGELKAETVREMADGLVRSRVGWLEIDLSCVALRDRSPRLAQALSQFTSSDLDLAFELEVGVTAQDLCRCVREACGDLAVGVELFDVFNSERLGATRRSLAVRVRLESIEGNIGEIQLAGIIQRVEEAVKVELGGVLRKS